MIGHNANEREKISNRMDGKYRNINNIKHGRFQPRSLKSTHTAHMCGGPKKVWRIKKLGDQKTWQLKGQRGPKCRENKQLEGQKIIQQTYGTQKN